MLIGVMIVFNDMPHLPDTVNSIINKVDRIVAVDGRFRDFPADNPLSDDGTREYLFGLPKVELIDAPDLYEHEKRNKYLIGKEGDWYLHLDADEEWIGDINIPEADMVLCNMRSNAPPASRFPEIIKRIRLFRHIDGLHYANKHYWLKDKDEKTFALLSRPGRAYSMHVDSDTNIVHNCYKRSPERIMQKRKYYRKLIRRENQFREID